MLKAKISVSPAHTVGVTDKRIYGSFIEHIGRAVYGGIYEPGHPTDDGFGFRGDVAALIKELDVPIIRYPGGNFVSGYNWEDGIGPKDRRPCRPDLAWKTTDTNQCGTDDFSAYCERIGSEPLMTVNLGTAGINEARNIVEYCNLPGGTDYAERRRANGFDRPHAIKTWCLGNEMDGVWQIGHKEAYEYGRLAAEASKVMKWVDPSIKTVLCGSSAPDVPTYPAWEETVLGCAYDYVDYISLHRYYDNNRGDTASFVASPIDAEEYINTVAAVCDYVKARKRSKKSIMLSFDEWNVWKHTCDVPHEKWAIAPPILEESYNVEDALVVGGMLITLLRHCDRVKIACLAQLVNVIAPIMTVNGGGTWKQTIFYPFADASNHGRGTVYDIRTDCPTYHCARGEVKYVDSAVVKNENGETVIFAVNRSSDETVEIGCDLTGIAGQEFTAVHTALTGAPKDCNSLAEPDRVVPHTCDAPSCRNGVLSCSLPAFSWNMIIVK